LILRGCSDVKLDGEMAEESGDISRAQFARVAYPVKADIARDPVDIALLGAARVVLAADHRPNLKVKSLTHPTRHRYNAVVVNNGITAAGPFELQLAVGSKLLDPVSIDGLAPHSQRLVTLHGPNCTPGTSLTVTADPLNLVDERNELDNAFTKLCG